MRIKYLVLTWSFILAVASGVSAQVAYVPAAANVEGLAGTQWHTDLQVKAGGGDGATFTVELLPEGEDNSDPLSAEFAVAAGQSMRLRDLVADVFDFTGSAALRVAATSGRILVTSRTFNDDPAGSYGQYVPAFDEDDAASSGTIVSILQLSRSPTSTSGFRTNIGFVNVSGNLITMVVDLFDADGILLGTLERRLKPYSYRQLNDVFAAVAATDVADGYAQVKTTTGGGRFIAYASVVDNLSGDAVLVPGQVDNRSVTEQTRLVVFEAFMRDT